MGFLKSPEFINFIQLIIVFIGSLLTKVFIPFIKSRTNEKEWQLLNKIGQTAVAWAEVKYAGVPKAGMEKRAAVQQYLEEKGYEISEEDLDVIIDHSRVQLGYVSDELKIK